MQSETSSMQLRKKKIDIDDHFTFSSGKYTQRSAKNVKHDVTANLYEVKEMVDEHIENVHTNLTDNAVRTIEYVQHVKRKFANALQTSQSQRTAKQIKLDPLLDPLRQLWDQVSASHDTEANNMQHRQIFQANSHTATVSNENEKLTQERDGHNKKVEKIREIPVDSKLEFRFRRDDNTPENTKAKKNGKVHKCMELLLIFDIYSMICFFFS